MMDIMGLVQMVRGGGNPMGALMGMSRQNPIIGQALQMVNGKTPMEMRRMVQNMAGQRGIDLGALMQKLGIRG